IDDPTLDVATDIGSGYGRVGRIAEEPPGETLDEAASEQRMACDRTTIHRELVVERRRDDATAPAHAELPEWPASADRFATPTHGGVERNAAVARIEHDEEVPHRDLGDIAQPGIKTQPRAGVALRSVTVHRDDVPVLQRRPARVGPRDR